jgi:hypothetical protein
MSEEKKPSGEGPENDKPAPAIVLSEEEQVRMILEQARQIVKQLARKEREGETINRELLNFRLRQINDP